ncbi:hypothetical protein KGQ19_00815 [Catenulispora sp. NL8]|uniref:Lipoprotein n=1 Tax=Catenulispora pinistramenti TaxID=2705254 RepID=A0ABS5KGJ5_9ACTN|nr:hypothetical protein [Catenulispora pinistramenti]MBS2545401.1 hypothetical protein [Catenulispora pinistramenti]
MNRSIRRALTAVAAMASLAFTGLTASACAAQPTVHKTNVITIPTPDQISSAYHTDQCPWLQLMLTSSAAAAPKASVAEGRAVRGPVAAVYRVLISSPLCTEYPMVGN